MSDLLLDAAQAYIKLMNFTYEVKIRVSKDIATINIDFRKDNFRHLAGIDKLKDLFSKEHISSENFLDMVLEEKFSYSDVLRSSYINEPINSPDKDGVSYYLPDRLKALCNLQNYLCNASPQSLSVHRWLSNAPKNLRPHQSNISADYLFTFRSAPCNKSSTEQVHSLLKAVVYLISVVFQFFHLINLIQMMEKSRWMNIRCCLWPKLTNHLTIKI